MTILRIWGFFEILFVSNLSWKLFCSCFRMFLRGKFVFLQKCVLKVVVKHFCINTILILCFEKCVWQTFEFVDLKVLKKLLKESVWKHVVWICFWFVLSSWSLTFQETWKMKKLLCFMFFWFFQKETFTLCCFKECPKQKT